MMCEAFLWWAFYAPPALRFFILWTLLSARLSVLNCATPPCLPRQSARHVQPCNTGVERDATVPSYDDRAERNNATSVKLCCPTDFVGPGLCLDHVRARVQYTRTELLAVSPAPLIPDVTARLRSLGLGVCLPRKRYRRKTLQPRPGEKPLKVLSFNCQSCREIATKLHDLIMSEYVDIVMLTETWLYANGDEAFMAALTPAGYDLRSFPRQSGRGGGIAFVVRNSLTPFITFTPLHFSSFEAVLLKIALGQCSTSCVCLYRPPPSKRNKLTSSMFFREFPELLSQFLDTHKDFSIHGDFNFHFDNDSDSQVSRLKTLLTDHNLSQLVDQPTHRKGHTLDWTVVRNERSLLAHECVKEFPGLSDHFAVFSTLSMTRPPPRTRLISSRDFKAVSQTEFQSDVKRFTEATGNRIDDLDVVALVDTYNNGLLEILDRHAPSVTRRVRDRPSAPWLTEEVREVRRKRRRAERQWRKSRLTVHRQILISARNEVKSCIQKAKRDYFSEQIDSASAAKQIFSVSDKLLGKSRSSPLPVNVPVSELPQKFCDFFSNKIRGIRYNLDQRPSLPPTFNVYKGPVLAEFESVTETGIYNLITALPPKSCILDPIPTNLTKECLRDLVPLITAIVNSSLSTGIVPPQFKQAIVKPLLKKPGLDVNVFGNFRPVSNLPFISKVLEKIVLKQLQNHLSSNNLIDKYQSAYKKGHSVETAVLSVLDGLLGKCDERLVSITALLDLSAAFDTLDHSILLQRLQISFGISGTVLAWFTSYVHDRFQRVVLDGAESSPSPLLYGVPQGSVLGPVLFSLYSQPLSDVISVHACDYHKYADDTELSKSAPADEFHTAVLSVQNCVHDVLLWMDSNKLKLNTDKTEVMPIGSPYRLGLIGCDSIDLDGSKVPFQTSVRYLGVTLDQSLSMQDQIGNVCRACYFHLRRIASIRSLLSQDAVIKLVSAKVLSRLDYCNSVLVSLPDEQLARLQQVQNSAARIILRKKKQDHVTPMLRELHWLPIKARCQYKIAVLAYQYFDGSLPEYLTTSLTVPKRKTSLTLRSSNEKRLEVPIPNMKTAGGHAFSSTAPSVWNSLPIGLRNQPKLAGFKSHLKTHLFLEYLE